MTSKMRANINGAMVLTQYTKLSPVTRCTQTKVLLQLKWRTALQLTVLVNGDHSTVKTGSILFAKRNWVS